jgi:hypothetical protein
MNLVQAAAVLERFGGDKITSRLSEIEHLLRGSTQFQWSNMLSSYGEQAEMLSAAALMKKVAGQINVVIHAVGILACLPRLLDQDEIVEYVSLGAGNTGRKFDLETNKRVAEFKFIKWRGRDAIRENSVFKDFLLLANHETHKRKYLYVLGTDHVLKFLNGGRALSSVMSHNKKLSESFAEKFGSRYVRVREYYQDHSADVSIEDVTRLVPQLSQLEAESTNLDEME